MNPDAVNQVALDAYAFTAVVMFLKLFSNGVIQGMGRTRARTFTNPEDARFFGAAEVAAEEAPVVKRAAAVFRNDLENIPIFLFLALVYVLLGCWPTGAIIYFSVFVGARILHGISYYLALQPWRTLFFTVGIAVCFILSVHIVVAALA